MKRLLPLLLAAFRLAVGAGAPLPADSSTDIKTLVDGEYSSLLDLYLYLHAYPELSLHEVRTSERMRKELEDAGFEVTAGVGGHGFVAVLENGEQPVVMVRTDLDALPVTEATNLDYASKVRARDNQGNEVGVMHACGHDVHMTCFAGAARLLSRLRNQWTGTLVMIGQPAEELSTGAKAMLADGLYRRFPQPSVILALHTDAGLEAGKVRIREGNALAGTDNLDLTMRGVSGHGAYAYTTKDPIVLSAQTILALQTIVSREIPATDPAVVTIGSIHGGTKHNIIPDAVQLQLTVRYYSDAVRARILGSIERIANGIAAAGGIPKDRAPILKLRESESIPPVYNDPALTRRVTRSLDGVLGKENVGVAEPVMGGEDFGVYGMSAEKIPICLFWLGSVDPARFQQVDGVQLLPSLHSDLFAPAAEPTLKTGTLAMTAAVLDLLRN
ncbi:MAG: amidohydrolase [Bryobacteraceae bacterium]|nr:amidohydrolase [Bryobacteraceae bacterium]